MKFVYLSLLLCIAPIYSSEKMAPEVLPLIEHAMVQEVADFSILFSNFMAVKKPMVDLVEVSYNQKKYLICLKNGSILQQVTVATRPAW